MEMYREGCTSRLGVRSITSVGDAHCCRGLWFGRSEAKEGFRGWSGLGGARGCDVSEVGSAEESKSTMPAVGMKWLELRRKEYRHPTEW